MADITITPADVTVGDDAQLQIVVLGEAVSAGDVISYSVTNNNWVLASNATDVLSGSGNNNYIAMALSDGVSGQRITAAKPKTSITVGSVLTAGRVYVLSTGGAISPESDATTSDYATIIGYAESATVLYFNPISTGIQVA